jgi:hypothetical protein
MDGSTANALAPDPGAQPMASSCDPGDDQPTQYVQRLQALLQREGQGAEHAPGAQAGGSELGSDEYWPESPAASDGGAAPVEQQPPSPSSAPAAPVAPSPAAAAASSLLARAAGAMSGGQWAAALQHAAAARQLVGSTREVQQAEAVAGILLQHAAGAGPAAVLQLDSSGASPAAARQAFKRLAALVHPDKCPGLAQAHAAFMAMSAAAEQLAGSAGEQVRGRWAGARGGGAAAGVGLGTVVAWGSCCCCC